MKHTILFVLAACLVGPVPAVADGIRDNDPNNVRSVPRKGVPVPADKRKVLESNLAVLHGQIEALKTKNDPLVKRLLPDVEIYHRAVRCALEYDEFFHEREISKAISLLAQGSQRATDLADGQAPWTTATGLVVRGYRSKIDHTVQPYGLVIPEALSGTAARCDLWFHGRGETLSEVNFIDQRQKQAGRYTPKDTIVLHPYGRYSNAFKFAGEIDVLEALEHCQQHYRIDSERISVRGFSMGGAACWQFAVHYADRWFAANPGAGFSETPEFLKFFQKETLTPQPWEKKLWQLYDCPVYATNLAHCPTIAYSGELDIQKQAADMMEAALQKQGMDLVHLIGPETKHTIHPDSMQEIERRMDSLARSGRRRNPREVHFVTPTLRYNRMHWVTINRLEEHWSPARVDATIHDVRPQAFVQKLSDPLRDPAFIVHLTTSNVSDITLAFDSGECEFPLTRPVGIWTGKKPLLQAPHPRSDRSWSCRLIKEDGRWKVGEPYDDSAVAKSHKLQGPIDDAFMDSFIFVKPSGVSPHKKLQAWVESEQEHARVQWRQQFRGDARIKSDTEITKADIADANLILWGDITSNAILKKIAADLPVKWTPDAIKVNSTQYPAGEHALILICPNPLNPQRYVVLNSGFTYREYAYLNNARQVPMLPDWAVVSFAKPPGSQYPGKIVAADFFDENWQLKTGPESATEDSGDGESAEETADKKTDDKKSEESATNDDDAKTPTTDKTEKAENTPAAKK